MRRPVLALLLAACAPRAVPPPAAAPAGPEVDVVAFGSCNSQEGPQEFWDVIAAAGPDVFVAGGDNVYADVVVGPDGRVQLLPADLGRLDAAYAGLAASEPFRRFREAVPILPTWDDHDYGENDAGAEMPLKAQSQARFLDFWGVTEGDPRRQREGVYTAATYGPLGRRVQIVLLDTRSFRSALTERPAEPGQLGRRYQPSADTSGTMLGEAQWAWLEAVLREPADLRLVVSSIQVLAETHPFERWGNLPHERERLLALLQATPGVVLLTGDRHMGALYRRDGERPLVELTSSSLNRSFQGDEVDPARLGPLVTEDNFATVEIDWTARTAKLALRSATSGVAVRAITVPFDASAGR